MKDFKDYYLGMEFSKKHLQDCYIKAYEDKLMLIEALENCIELVDACYCSSDATDPFGTCDICLNLERFKYILKRTS